MKVCMKSTPRGVLFRNLLKTVWYLYESVGKVSPHVVVRPSFFKVIWSSLKFVWKAPHKVYFGKSLNAKLFTKKIQKSLIKVNAAYSRLVHNKSCVQPWNDRDINLWNLESELQSTLIYANFRYRFSRRAAFFDYVISFVEYKIPMEATINTRAVKSGILSISVWKCFIKTSISDEEEDQLKAEMAIKRKLCR